MRLRAVCVVILCLFVPVATMAQDHKDALIQDLYNQSGMEKQIGQLPMVIQIGFDQAVESDGRLKTIPRGDLEDMRANIPVAYDPRNIRQTIMRECREKLSRDELKHVLGWLNSSLGRQLTQLEEASSSPEAYMEMQRYALALQNAPPAPERLSVIRQLDAAIKITEGGVEIAMNTQLAVAIAVVASLPAEQQPTYAKLAEALEQHRPRLEDEVRIQTLFSLLYTYQSVSDAALAEYAAFASSAAGTNYHYTAMSGLKKAMLEGAYKWGESIAQILQKSEKRTEL